MGIKYTFTLEMASNPNIQKLYTFNKLTFTLFTIEIQSTNGFRNNGRNKISLAINLFYQIDHHSFYMIWDFWK